MNENFSFNDTFDGISFSDSGRVRNEDTYEQLRNKKTVSNLEQQNDENLCISIDDSVFLSDSFTFLAEQNSYERNAKSSQDIFNVSDTCTDLSSDANSRVLVSNNAKCHELVNDDNKIIYGKEIQFQSKSFDNDNTNSFERSTPQVVTDFQENANKIHNGIQKQLSLTHIKCTSNQNFLETISKEVASTKSDNYKFINEYKNINNETDDQIDYINNDNSNTSKPISKHTVALDVQEKANKIHNGIQKQLPQTHIKCISVNTDSPEVISKEVSSNKSDHYKFINEYKNINNEIHDQIDYVNNDNTNTSKPKFTVALDTQNGIHNKAENLLSQSGKRRKLSDWNLPDAILQKYESQNIKEMFTWQCECLENEDILHKNKNLVYSAPTSAGKTLVSEILAIKTLVERNKKVIFILPFVSVVREKMFYFKEILDTSGIRVEGFMGSYNPPGGFQTVQLAICTIEKANSLINRLLEENKLSDIGTVIVDEMHLLGDSSRGYLLELLLTKLNFMSVKHEDVNIQIIGMSATLPNLSLLADWLNAVLYTTEFRPIPLFEQFQVQGEIYDNKMTLLRKLPVLEELGTDTDNILQLCLETIQNSCSVLIFCPTKNWCENLAQQLAMAIWKLGIKQTDLGKCLRDQLNSNLIWEVLEQLRRCPVGLDKILEKTVSFGVTFHHAGLTMDERDIVEGAFRSGAIRILVATSTLSSGVNLPARRVIIRTPIFHGKAIDNLTYQQMIGRAGRMGKDTAGESLLICQKNDYRIAKELMTAKLEPIESCLTRSGKLKRAILEVVASGVVSTPKDVLLFTACTLFANEEGGALQNPIEEAIEFLKDNQFLRFQVLEDGSEKYVATSLAKACLSSSMPPEEGLALFTELEKARQCFVLESELHLVYLVTPYSACNQWGNIDWIFFLSLWEKLPPSMKRVGNLVGIREAFLVNASRGRILNVTKDDYHNLQIHKRFYVALALQDLVNEVPLNDVAVKFNCARGTLQSLQQSASTFAGMVTSFSKQLGWSSVEILISQFQDRLHFGVNRDLLDLMRLPVLNGPRARALYNAGIETLVQLASTSADMIENALHKMVPFESAKERVGESKHDAEQRKKIRNIWITGKQGLTEEEAANMLIEDAREYLQWEMGLVDAKWETDNNDIQNKSKNIEKNLNESILKGTNRNKSFVKELEYTDSLAKQADIQENFLNLHGPNNCQDMSKETSLHSPHKENKSRNSDIFEADTVSCNLNNSCTKTELEDESCNKLNISNDLMSPIEIKTQSEDLNIGHFSKANNSCTKIELENESCNKLNISNDLMSPIEIKTQSEDLNIGHFSKENIKINWSNDSLFENSFECLNINNIPCNSLNEKANSIEQKQISPLENDSYLENVSSTEFVLLESANPNRDTPVFNKSLESSTPTNTSSECIHSSQTSTDLLVTPFKKTSITRINSSSKKRRRSTDDIINSNSDNSCLKETPRKRMKSNRKNKSLKKRKSIKLNQNIDATFIISQNSTVYALPYKNQQKSSTDLTELEIIDVCGDQDLFKSFCVELRDQKEIAFSIGCVKIEVNKPKIGDKVLNTENNPNNKNIELSHGTRQIKGVSISWGGNTAYYINLDSNAVSLKIKTSLLTNVLNNHELKVKMFDCKEQIKFLKLCLGLDVDVTLEDAKVADWLLNPEAKEKNLQAMVLKYSPEAVKLAQLAGNCKGVGSVGLDLYSSITPRVRSSVEAISTWHVVNSILDVIAQQEMKLLHTFYIEMKTISVLSKMELNGICVSKSELQKLTNDLKEYCKILENKVYKLSGRQFSLASSTEVAKVLGMYKGRRVSTSKQVLEQNNNPIAALVIQWRKLNCTLTKMLYPFLNMVQNERIHGTCITFSATGRVSMHDPNLQSIPREFQFLNPLDNNAILINCRNVFKTTENFVLISADYCQLELRLLAHLSKDLHLCSIMRTKEDVFKSIAAKLNNIDEDEVIDELRQRAKQICYGIIYGMGLKALADQLNSTQEEAASFLEEFHKKYPSINVYIKKVIKECQEEGYVETIAGRRRYLPNIKHEHLTARSQAERQAVNTTIQGSAADIAKNAMVLIDNHIQNKFKSSKNKPRLILHLHDEFIYEVPEKYAKVLIKILRNCMMNSVQLDVPFPVKIKQGKSWGNLKEIHS